MERITPLLEFRVNIEGTGINPTPVAWFSKKSHSPAPGSREKTRLLALIRIRLDPIYSQLTEKDRTRRGLRSIYFRSKRECHLGELVTTATVFRFDPACSSDKYPMARQWWTISNREWLNSRFSTKLDAGQVSVIPSNAKEKGKTREGREAREKGRERRKRRVVEESGLISESRLREALLSIEGHNDVLVGRSRASLVDLR